MNKYKVSIKWVEETSIIIEAHSQEEADALFDDKYMNDDAMRKYISEQMLTDGPCDEDWNIEPADDNEYADFRYDELVDEEEEDDEE